MWRNFFHHRPLVYLHTRLWMSKTMTTNTSDQAITFLGQKDAQDFDNSLFFEYQYSIDQLMEIAGA